MQAVISASRSSRGAEVDAAEQAASQRAEPLLDYVSVYHVLSDTQPAGGRGLYVDGTA